MATEPAYTTSLEISELRLDCGVTPRHAPVKVIHDLFVHLMKTGTKFEPVVVFQNPQNVAEFWLADGHHRLHAYRECGDVYIAANVYRGTRYDAMFYGNSKAMCVAAAAVDIINAGKAPRSSKRLPSWWKVEGEV